MFSLSFDEITFYEIYEIALAPLLLESGANVQVPRHGNGRMTADRGEHTNWTLFPQERSANPLRDSRLQIQPTAADGCGAPSRAISPGRRRHGGGASARRHRGK